VAVREDLLMFSASGPCGRRLALSRNAVVAGAALCLIGASYAAAAGPQVTVLYSFDDGVLRSSPLQEKPHHRFEGDFALDHGRSGGGPVFARFANPTGALSLSVVRVYDPCGVKNSGGRAVEVNVNIEGQRVGRVFYYHLQNIPVVKGKIEVGARVGDMITAIPAAVKDALDARDRDRKARRLKALGRCWTGAHVHVEPKNDAGGRACFVSRRLGTRFTGPALLGVIGGGYTGTFDAACPAGADTPAASAPTPEPPPPPDRDSDGVPDAVDACPIAAGSAQNRGCPPPRTDESRILAVGDFDADGFSDSAVGLRSAQVGALPGAGAVSVIYGSSAGLSPVRSTTLWQTDAAGGGGLSGAGAESDDQLGTAAAAADFDRDGFADLVVGVPGEDIGAVVDAGAISVIYGGAGGLNPARSTTLWQTDANGQGGLSGAGAEPGDRVGAALVAGDLDGDGYSDLAVGVPGEDIGALADAGAVSVIYGSPTGLNPARSATHWQTDAAGAGGLSGGGAEPGDQVGASLAAGDLDGDGRSDLAVGVPGEDIGALADAGAVSVIYGSPSGLNPTRSVTRWQRDSSGGGGLAGAGAEPADLVGAAVSVGDFDADKRGDLVAWAPGEDVGTVDVGAISVLHGASSGLDGGRSATLWRLGRDAESGWGGTPLSSPETALPGGEPEVAPNPDGLSPTAAKVDPLPGTVKVRTGRSRAIIVTARITTSGEKPTGSCAVDRRTGKKWRTMARARLGTAGVCRVVVHLRGKGVVRLRVRFLPDPGWRPTTKLLAPIRLV
jgi:FG-GAP repeat